MRRFIITVAVAVTAAIAPSLAQAQDTTAIPEPEVIQTRIGTTPMFELNDGGGGLPYLGVSHPYNAGDWEGSLREYHDSGVYDRAVAKVDELADRQILRGGGHPPMRARARSHGRGHGLGHGPGHPTGPGHGRQKLALVLDIDETALSNYSAISADNFTYGPNSQAEAVNEIGVAIQPTLKLYRDAQARGIAVFFITGRPEAERQPTIENLQREGYSNWAGLTLKQPGTTMTTVQYKSSARAAIEQQGYRIIANVGDQYSDLAGGHADVAYKLANPFYFLP
jgi:acid phosphatase